jgi:hypothetical protein
MMQYDPVPPEGCTCASFWTVRGKHKADCPLSSADDELEQWYKELNSHNRGGGIYWTIQPEELRALINDKLEATEKAYGGCHLCFGKGYASYKSAVSWGHGDVDLGATHGPGKRDTLEMRYCSCDRGKQLKSYVEAEVAKVKLGIRQQLGSLLPQNYAKAKPDIEKGIKSVIESIDRQLKENNPNE